MLSIQSSGVGGPVSPVTGLAFAVTISVSCPCPRIAPVLASTHEPQLLNPRISPCAVPEECQPDDPRRARMASRPIGTGSPRAQRPGRLDSLWPSCNICDSEETPSPGLTWVNLETGGAADPRKDVRISDRDLSRGPSWECECIFSPGYAVTTRSRSGVAAGSGSNDTPATAVACNPGRLSPHSAPNAGRATTRPRRLVIGSIPSQMSSGSWRSSGMALASDARIKRDFLHLDMLIARAWRNTAARLQPRRRDNRPSGSTGQLGQGYG